MTVEQVCDIMGWVRPDLYAERVLDTYLTENPHPPRGSVEWRVSELGHRTGRTTKAVAETVAALEGGREVVAVVKTEADREDFERRVRAVRARMGRTDDPKLRVVLPLGLRMLPTDGSIHYVLDCF